MAWWAPVPHPDPHEVPHSTVLSWLDGIKEDREVRQTGEERQTYDSLIARVTVQLLPRWMTRPWRRRTEPR